MKNNFLIAQLYKNCFFVDLSTSLDVHKIEINSIAKIDTGCGFTSIHLFNRRFLLGKEDITRLKKEAINLNLKAGLSFGVSDTDDIKKHEEMLFKSGNLLECKCINFKHNISKFLLNGYDIEKSSIRVSYNRQNNILIGMDVLQLFDFHCGYSRVLDNYIFIGVLRTQEDKSDYYKALEEHFGILSNINEDFLNSEAVKIEASGFFAWLKNKHKN